MTEIRTARIEDIPTIHNLGEGVDEFHTSEHSPNFWPETVLEKCVDKEDVYFFVATQADEIVGFIIANCNRSLSKVLIENIFVKPAFRGQGIGSSLAKKVVETARSQKFQFIITLIPPDDMAATMAYESAGFARGEVFVWLDVEK